MSINLIALAENLIAAALILSLLIAATGALK